MSMSSGLIKVDYPTIQQAIENTRQTASFMENQLSNLQTDLGQLRQMWEGPAASSYNALQQKWNQAYTDLNTILNKISTELQEILTYYQNTENKLAGAWDGGSKSA